MNAGLDVVLRADAGACIGIGHVMRCLSLGLALREAGHHVRWRSQRIPESLLSRITAAGMTVDGSGPGDGDEADASATAGAGGDACVVDGYHFSAAFSAHLARHRPTLVIDDGSPVMGDGHRAAACLLNPNLYAHADLYPGHPGRLLLGSRFALLRPEFRQQVDPPAHHVRRIVLTMGGADPIDATSWALDAILGSFADIPIDVVLGAANPRADRIISAHRSCARVVFLRHAANMADVLMRADLVVTACGGTVLECMRLSRPCIVVPIAENQRLVARHIASNDLAIVVEPGGDLAPVLRQCRLDLMGLRHRAIRAAALVDGLGPERVVSAVEASAHGVGLRPADASDEAITLSWANDPETRAASFGRAEIAIADHARWFAARLADARCRLWIAESSTGEPVGSVRLDLPTDPVQPATIHIVLAPTHRGRGLAARIISAACRRLQNATANGIEAFILESNQASLRAFARAGFRQDRQVSSKGQPTAVLRWFPTHPR